MLGGAGERSSGFCSLGQSDASHGTRPLKQSMQNDGAPGT
jgi:hypothetical protein